MRSVSRILQNFQRCQTARRSHDAAARMCGRAAQIKVLDRRSILRPARYGTQEEKLLQRKLALKNIALAQPELAFQIEWCEHLPPNDDVFDVWCMLGQSIDHRIAKFLPLLVPIETRTQLVGRVLNETGEHMFSRRRH